VFCILLDVGVLDLYLASYMLLAAPVAGALEEPLWVDAAELVVLLTAPALAVDVPAPVRPAVLAPAAELVVLVFFSSSVNLRSISSKAYLRTSISASFSLCLF
jgi:hypothetical protein